MSIEVKTANLSIEPDGLEKHLRDEDFLHVDKYPTSTFSLISVADKPSGESTHEVTGDLTMKGTTKRISFPAKVELSDVSAKASASFKIDRTDFGITYPGMANDLIKDEVLLELTLVFGA